MANICKFCLESLILKLTHHNYYTPDSEAQGYGARSNLQVSMGPEKLSELDQRNEWVASIRLKL